ncbi:MAG: SpoIIE family protein phosphatase [Planctomycetaceae bacterium]
MAFLKVIQGKAPQEILELIGERTIIGRHPTCGIVLESAAVSRHHAQILVSHGRYYLEDLRSRNRTLLNGQALEGRDKLNDRDSIQVCDVIFRFHEKVPSDDDSPLLDLRSRPQFGQRSRSDKSPDGLPNLLSGDEAADDSSDDSSVITTINTRSGTELRLGVRPEVKLRAVLEIGRVLASVLDLDEVLQKTLGELFQMFSQADEGFVLLRNRDNRKLALKATKTRSGRGEAAARISTTIVRQAMESGNAVLSADPVKDTRFKSSDSIPELQIKSMMCVPLSDKGGNALGVIQLASLDIRRPFSQDDLDVLVSVASQVGMAVENARLHEDLLQQREIERDLEFATQIQLGFLPNKRPNFADYEFADYYESAMRVGGDYFDYIALPDGRVAVALGDVAGKGIPAALMMARLYSSARFHLLTQPDVAGALCGLNAEFASSGLGFRFITLVAAVLDPKTNEITIANAGHLPPLFRRQNGDIELLAKANSGMPLGVAPQETFHETKVKLEPGETLTFYTDGITESMNANNKIYGRDRLCRLLARMPANAEQTVNGIINDVETFCSGRPQRDDVCLVCLVRRK